MRGSEACSGQAEQPAFNAGDVMTGETGSRPRPLHGRERSCSYGWTSIALHWLTATAIVALLFAGDSISYYGASARQAHTTIAACVWLLLTFRIVWRLWQGHPPPASGRAGIAHAIAVTLHYAMLAAIGLMLVSGPLTGWASGVGIDVFALHIPGAATPQDQLNDIARWAHGLGAITLVICISVHIAGAVKHMFVDAEGTFGRMMAPTRKRSGE